MLRFQFHNGTIKTIDELPTIYFKGYFNSIMVQLKLPNIPFISVTVEISIP